MYSDDKSEFPGLRCSVIKSFKKEVRQFAKVPEHYEMESRWINPESKQLDKTGQDLNCTVQLGCKYSHRFLDRSYAGTH